MSTYLQQIIIDAIESAYKTVRGEEPPGIYLNARPSDRPEFGDYTANIALLDASDRGLTPRDVARDLTEAIDQQIERNPFDDVQVAGPGFINFFLKPETIRSALKQILCADRRYGSSESGVGQRIQVEFVSSNPTGPLTVGHGRQAVLGDVLASLYERLGYEVEREYYFNDEGRQVDLLAESLWVRYRELFGESREIPEGGYQGEYLRGIGQTLHAEWGEDFPSFDQETQIKFRQEAVARLTAIIKQDLADLGIHFDVWFSEADLYRNGEVDAAIRALRDRNGVYEEDGATWLRAENFGGIKDSVVVRSDGRPTYLMGDIAYHINKHNRGFARVINVQGGDHQVEQSCVQSAMRILGLPDDFVQYAVHQFVSLKEKGEVLRMSTRVGRFVTLRDLLDGLGKNIVRYFMISRKPDAHLDFDLDLARSESLDNPATYIQYAHTRIASIFRKTDVDNLQWTDVDLSPLVEKEELDLIKALDRFPEVIRTAALSFAPHLLPEYALHLSRSFHAYYDKHRVLTDDERLTHARLALLRAVQLILRHSLNILGMDAPEEM